MKLPRPRFAALACTVSFAAHLSAQTPAMPSDCTGPRALEDPRCQFAPALEDTRRQSPPSRIPVIRDTDRTPLEREPRRTVDEPIEPERTPPVPEPPTEFQKFVEQATGERLPIFGRKLFNQVPSTFAPADRVPVTPGYALGPGDQVAIRAWGAIDLNVSPVVDRSGAIYIPHVGEVTVAGIQFAQLQDYLKTAIGRVYRNFDLSVSMGQLRSIQVLVTGQARRPGAYTISSLSTLVNAVFASGGPNPQGSMRGIRVMRAGRPAAQYDLYDLLVRGDTACDTPLLSGDVIYIPPAGPQVALTGSVNVPGIYELKGDTTLAGALALAGGLTPVAAKRQAMIQRVGESSLQAIAASLETGAPDEPLRNGDIVSVLAVVPRFGSTVTLKGNVADPIRLPWRAGMRIRDLIPEREALLTRDYWRERNRTAPASTQDPAAPADIVADAGNPDVRAPSPDRTLLASLEPGATAATAQRPRNSAANAGTPGSIAAAPAAGAVALNRIRRNPLEINWSYAVIERLNPGDLSATLVPFHLGRAVIDRDPTEDLPLQPGDVVTVFSTSDLKSAQSQQTRYVRLEGEFASAGIYSVQPGETLRDVVKRSGGLTQQAYLYGSELLRTSTRIEQQQRLDDAVNSLERETASTAANIRGSVLSPEEAAAANSQISAQRELVEKLRTVRAQGRIVLDLEPQARGTSVLPELQLEDGDVFIVPSRPAFVNVVGSVYNGTSFLWAEDKRLDEYLRAAGGPTRTADSRHAFLIRADGSVVSKSWSNSVTSRRFRNLPLNPGDTIVVPEQVNRTTFMKGLKDWSQIFAQLGLGAAAINVLR